MQSFCRSLIVGGAILAVQGNSAAFAKAQDRTRTQGSGAQGSPTLGGRFPDPPGATGKMKTRPGQEFTVKRVRDTPPLKKWHFEYFAEFTGPSADFALPLESFSTSSDYYAPMALYQSLTLAYALSENNRLGATFSANKPLQSEVLDRFYNYYSSQFTVFDPSVFLQLNNLLTNPYSWVNLKVSLDLPTSTYSSQTLKITTLYLGPTWNFILPNPKFYFRLNLDLYYNLYEHQEGFTRFTASPGHTGGYNFNPHWSIDTTSAFDFSLISQGGRGYQFTEGNVDRIKFTLRYQPWVSHAQFGAFLVSPIYYRRLDRMAVGLNFTLWL